MRVIAALGSFLLLASPASPLRPEVQTSPRKPPGTQQISELRPEEPAVEKKKPAAISLLQGITEFPANYESLSASEKKDLLWARILQDEDQAADAPWAISVLRLFSYFRTVKYFGFLFSWTEDLSTTFSHVNDLSMPKGHKKVIHPVGSVAKVSLEWLQHDYTGLFGEKQQDAIIRIAPAGPVSDKGFAPGLSLKVLRTGRDSANTFALFSLRGQGGSFSQFEHLLCNKLSDFRDASGGEKYLLKSFRMASKYPFTTGLSHWTDGKADTDKFPFVLCFRPTEKVRERFADTPKFGHIQEQLGMLESGTVLYDIYASAEPHGPLEKIGGIQLESEFKKSAWADQTMFFRHDWFEKDLELRPTWKAAVDDPDFWYTQGANNDIYGVIDPGLKNDPGQTKNAWAGGYDPKSVKEAVTDAASQGKASGSESLASLVQRGGAEQGDTLEAGTLPYGCPFSKLFER